jgi:hypothetical protein
MTEIVVREADGQERTLGEIFAAYDKVIERLQVRVRFLEESLYGSAESGIGAIDRLYIRGTNLEESLHEHLSLHHAEA